MFTLHLHNLSFKKLRFHFINIGVKILNNNSFIYHSQDKLIINIVLI